MTKVAHAVHEDSLRSAPVEGKLQTVGVQGDRGELLTAKAFGQSLGVTEFAAARDLGAAGDGAALYPKDSDEKRLLDAMLLAMPR